MTDRYECCVCGEPIWMRPETHAVLKRSGASFHCLFGHSQFFPRGKSETDKLKEQLEQERRSRQRAEQQVAYQASLAKDANEAAIKERNRANGYKGHAARITKRAKAGVCPCCNRTFQNMADHMRTQHPTFTPLEEKEAA